MFVNSLALRTRIDHGEKFSDLLSRVRRDDLADMANTDVAFDTIVANVLNSTTTSHNPLFQVMFAFQNIDFPSLELDDVVVSPVAEGIIPAKVDLQLNLYPNDPAGGANLNGGSGAMKAQLVFATDLFDKSTVETIVQRYLLILEAIAADAECIVGDIVIFTVDEQAESVDSVPADIRLPDLVSAANDADPEAIAVTHGGGATVHFGQLSEMVRAMAAALPGVRRRRHSHDGADECRAGSGHRRTGGGAGRGAERTPDQRRQNHRSVHRCRRKQQDVTVDLDAADISRGWGALGRPPCT